MIGRRMDAGRLGREDAVLVSQDILFDFVYVIAI